MNASAAFRSRPFLRRVPQCTTHAGKYLGVCGFVPQMSSNDVAVKATWKAAQPRTTARMCGGGNTSSYGEEA